MFPMLPPMLPPSTYNLPAPHHHPQLDLVAFPPLCLILPVSRPDIAPDLISLPDPRLASLATSMLLLFPVVQIVIALLFLISLSLRRNHIQIRRLVLNKSNELVRILPTPI